MTITAVIIFGSMQALADSYSVDMEIFHDPPTYLPMTPQMMFFTGVAEGYADTTVVSTWSHLTCSVINGDVNVVFDGKRDDWPTTWPSSATCSSGGHSLTINLSYIDRPPEYDHNPFISASQTELSVYSPNSAPVEDGFYLPQTIDLVEGDYTAWVSGQPWPWVRCVVEKTTHTGGYDMLRIRATASTAEGSGECVLPLSEGGTYSLDLNLSRTLSQ